MVRAVDRVSFLWLLAWPAYVVGWGLIVGYAMALWSCTPKHQIRSVLAACAFANSTGLPITLFSVLTLGGNSQNPNVVDPTLLLSIYLLSYPMLQWGVGSWLLAPEPVDSDSSSGGSSSFLSSLRHSAEHTLIKDGAYGRDDGDSAGHDYQELVQRDRSVLPLTDPLVARDTQTTTTNNNNNNDNNNTDDVSAISAVTATSSPTKPNVCRVCCQTALSSLIKIIRQCVFQPPVLAAIAGFLVATFPKLRGIFVDIVDRDGDAPTQWFFDALYGVGQAAVPINMILLGSNLSQSLMRQQQTNDNAADGTDQTVSGSTNNNLLSKQTMAAVVFGKLVVMPLIGIGSVVLLSLFVWNLPQGKSANGSTHDS